MLFRLNQFEYDVRGSIVREEKLLALIEERTLPETRTACEPPRRTTASACVNGLDPLPVGACRPPHGGVRVRGVDRARRDVKAPFGRRHPVAESPIKSLSKGVKERNGVASGLRTAMQFAQKSRRDATSSRFGSDRYACDAARLHGPAPHEHFERKEKCVTDNVVVFGHDEIPQRAEGMAGQPSAPLLSSAFIGEGREMDFHQAVHIIFAGGSETQSHRWEVSYPMLHGTEQRATNWTMRLRPCYGQTMRAEPALGPSVSGGVRLGGARADFVAGLGRRVNDLAAALRCAEEAPSDLPSRNQLRRKFQALSCGARMMKFDAMDRAISEALCVIDRTPLDQPMGRSDVDALEHLLAELPALAWGVGLRTEDDGESGAPSRVSLVRSRAAQYHALIVGSAAMGEALLESRSDGLGFVCESTPNTEAALELARTKEVDLILLDADLPGATTFVETATEDALTGSIPIVVVGTFHDQEHARFIAMGVAKTLPKPTTRQALRATCEEILDPRRGPLVGWRPLGVVRLEDLAERLAHEVQRALVDSADPTSRGERIDLGEGGDVFGALWAALGRVREVVAARSDGRVRFGKGPEGTMLVAPELNAEVRGSGAPFFYAGARDVQLAGKRAIVADDDPGVVWLIADVLRSVGCEVHEAFDGREALDLAYRTSPDLVVSDIVMPKLDGFSLCRALRRDVALRDVPVILLSWKEDLLQRVRELGAGAAGYIRKESDTHAIVARVREALVARGRIEARLAGAGDVRGRLGGVNVCTLLAMVCASRRDARLAIRDASFLYEVDVRRGVPRRATRTSGEGDTLRGSAVFDGLIGVGAGRFAVSSCTEDVADELTGTLPEQLALPIARARAATALLLGQAMPSIARVVLDEDSVASHSLTLPRRARMAVERLASGDAPRSLVDSGFESSLVEDILADLAGRNFVRSVENVSGDDLMEAATRSFLRAACVPDEADPDDMPSAAPSPAAASLADAVLEELLDRSGNGEPKAHSQSPRADKNTRREPAVHEPGHKSGHEPGTPESGHEPETHEPTLPEPTSVDGVLAAERSFPIEFSPSGPAAAMGPRQEQSGVLVELSNEERAVAGLPTKKRLWQAVALTAAVGGAGWALFNATSVFAYVR